MRRPLDPTYTILPVSPVSVAADIAVRVAELASGAPDGAKPLPPLHPASSEIARAPKVKNPSRFMLTPIREAGALSGGWLKGKATAKTQHKNRMVGLSRKVVRPFICPSAPPGAVAQRSQTLSGSPSAPARRATAFRRRALDWRRRRDRPARRAARAPVRRSGPDS